MPHYELIYLISPGLSKGEVSLIAEEINLTIEKGEGDIIEKGNQNIPKKNLAYLIKKKNQAYFCSLKFRLNKEDDFKKEKFFQELEKELKKREEILRYLILKHKKKVVKIPREKFLYKTNSKKEPKEQTKKRKKTVPLNEIGEKLDEILEE